VPNYHIRVRGSRDALADLVRVHRVHVLRPTFTDAGDEVTVDAIADAKTVKELEKGGYVVERLEDVDKAAKATLRDVGKGNRFLDEKQAER
jgi:carboxypeptidase T